MYTLMGMLICEAGKAGSNRAAGSEGPVVVACLVEPQAPKKNKALTIRIPGKIFMTGMEGFEL